MISKLVSRTQSNDLSCGESLAEEVEEGSIFLGYSFQTQPWLPTPSTCALKTILVCSATPK